MRIPEVLHPADAPVLATAQGIVIFDERPILHDIVGSFAALPEQPERCLRGHGLHAAAVGDNAELWNVQGVAVKMSSLSTGRAAHRSSKPIIPEDLVSQMSFMHALGERLAERTDGTIRVPDQYFALRAEGGYLLAQQYMTGWIGLGLWAHRQKLSHEQYRTQSNAARTRIIQAIGRSILRFGINDLGLYKGTLHGGNVLVPAESDSLHTAPLCIIDQPSQPHGLARYAVRTARHTSGIIRLQ